MLAMEYESVNADTARPAFVSFARFLVYDCHLGWKKNKVKNSGGGKVVENESYTVYES